VGRAGQADQTACNSAVRLVVASLPFSARDITRLQFEVGRTDALNGGNAVVWRAWIRRVIPFHALAGWLAEHETSDDTRVPSRNLRAVTPGYSAGLDMFRLDQEIFTAIARRPGDCRIQFDPSMDSES